MTVVAMFGWLNVVRNHVSGGGMRLELKRDSVGKLCSYGIKKRFSKVWPVFTDSCSRAWLEETVIIGLSHAAL